MEEHQGLQRFERKTNNEINTQISSEHDMFTRTILFVTGMYFLIVTILLTSFPLFVLESLKNHHIHHRSGLPAKFWVTIAFLIVGFHLYLAKLIYSECFKEKDIVRSKIYMS